MTQLLKHWDKLFAISGLIFYAGAWFQRSGSAVEEAANAATVVALQQELAQLTTATISNSDAITKLIANQASMQEQLNQKGKH